jgi:uncharacterized RDD family membrane protein YckC
MRCPKCQYISFDTGDRCRNCGYEFSLTVDARSADLPIQTGAEAIGPFSDFSLGDLDAAPVAGPAADTPPASKAPATAGFDLPLFKDRAPDDDRPLVTSAAVPRAPLAVRKSSPVVPRAARRQVDEPELDLEPPEADEGPVPAPHAPQPAYLPEPTDVTAAPLARRFAAAAIDLLVLGVIDVTILYFTLRLCGLQFAEIDVIPPAPFAAFVLLQNGAYFVALVAIGGQTIGKMALHLRVVPVGAADGWTDRVGLGTAVVRAAAWFLTVLPAGIGLLPALLDGEGRAVHDRLAGTRVVKA